MRPDKLARIVKLREDMDRLARENVPVRTRPSVSVADPKPVEIADKPAAEPKEECHTKKSAKTSSEGAEEEKEEETDGATSSAGTDAVDAAIIAGHLRITETLAVSSIMARNLKAQSKNEKHSNPYVVVGLIDADQQRLQKQKTPVSKKELNPQWPDVDFKLKYSSQQLTDGMVFRAEVKHKMGNMFQKNQTMGYVDFALKDLAGLSNEWHAIKMEPEDKAGECGELNVIFGAKTSEDAAPPTPNPNLPAAPATPAEMGAEEGKAIAAPAAPPSPPETPPDAVQAGAPRPPETPASPPDESAVPVPGPPATPAATQAESEIPPPATPASPPDSAQGADTKGAKESASAVTEGTGASESQQALKEIVSILDRTTDSSEVRKKDDLAKQKPAVTLCLRVAQVTALDDSVVAKKADEYEDKTEQVCEMVKWPRYSLFANATGCSCQRRCTTKVRTAP